MFLENGSAGTHEYTKVQSKSGLSQRTIKSSPCAGADLLVFSKSFEARRLHVVSPAAQPVMAFYVKTHVYQPGSGVTFLS